MQKCHPFINYFSSNLLLFSIYSICQAFISKYFTYIYNAWFSLTNFIKNAIMSLTTFHQIIVYFYLTLHVKTSHLFFLFAFLHFSIFLIWSLHSWFLFHPHNFIGYMLRSPFLGQSVGKRLSIGPKGFSTCKNALLSSITFHQNFIYLILWRFTHMNFS